MDAKNNTGQIVFRATFGDGSEAIVRADPVSPSPPLRPGGVGGNRPETGPPDLEVHGLYEQGVIRFQADHRAAALDPQVHGAVAHSLISWRDRLLRAGLVGRDANRYGGVGFGNLSGRLPPFPGSPGWRPFLVTGTQTGDRDARPGGVFP